MRHIGFNPAKHFGFMLTVVLAFGSLASASWKEKVIYSFQGGNDGAIPAGGVAFDQAGNLYGATSQGGGSNCPPISNCGTVFQLSPPAQKGDPWTETVLHVFSGVPGNDGATPAGGTVIDANGNLYGTTGYGGSGGCVLVGIKGGCGTVYELSPPQTKGGAWTYTILYSFQSGDDGYFPWGDLTLDSKGNLYGATQFGGGKGTSCNSLYQYCGTVFELSPPKQKGGKWTEKVLHSFAGGTDGAYPNGGLLLGLRGQIYGTTSAGGNQECKSAVGVGCGTAFRLTSRKTRRDWAEKQLHVFTGGKDGAGPNGGLIFDAKDSLYGTTGGGGEVLSGIVFRLRPEAGDRWIENVLYAFSDGNAPCCPQAGVIFDTKGNLDGVALSGTYFLGTTFRLMHPGNGKGWSLSLLNAFTGSPDGNHPVARLALNQGKTYSTTLWGGTGQRCQGGCGSVFELSP